MYFLRSERLVYFSELTGKWYRYFLNRIKVNARAVLIIFPLLFCLSVGNIAAQKLRDLTFNEIYFTENFDKNLRGWLNVNTGDNFFIIKNGEYVLQRRNTKSQDIILCPFASKAETFQLTVRLRMENYIPKTSYGGFIFNATQDGLGAIAIEFNPLGEYRIKKMAGSSWIHLSTKTSIAGWVKSATLDDVESEIEFVIRGSEEFYDFYINGTFLETQKIPDLRSGSFGFIVGPSTKIIAQEITIMTNPEYQTIVSKSSDNTQLKTDLTTKNKTDREIGKQADSRMEIQRLERKTDEMQLLINQLTAQNQTYKKNAGNTQVTELYETIEKLQSELNASYESKKKLEARNNNLQAELNQHKRSGKNSTQQNNSSSKTSSAYDETLYQKYADKVKENITLKSELEHFKSGNYKFDSNSNNNLNSNNSQSSKGSKNQTTQLRALQNKIFSLQEQLNLAIEFNEALLGKGSIGKYQMNVAASSSAGEFHVVSKGETLYGISKKYPNLSLQKLKSLNNLKGNELNVGQKLLIR